MTGIKFTIAANHKLYLYTFIIFISQRFKETQLYRNPIDNVCVFWMTWTTTIIVVQYEIPSVAEKLQKSRFW